MGQLANSTAMTKLLVDCDTGIDDALALLYLAAADCTIVGVGTVFGNVGVEQASWNTQKVLAMCGLRDVPVACGASEPLAGVAHFGTSVHGDDGLGGQGMPGALGPFACDDAADQLIGLVRQFPQQLTLLATGPLTNLALALQRDPSIGEQFARIIVMGGAVTTGGNATAVAEANIFNDPEAAEIVFSSCRNMTLVPLDVTMKVTLDEEVIGELAARPSRLAQFAASILMPYGRFYRERHGMGCALHDPLAAVLALSPHLAAYQDWTIAVETEGRRTRGMILAERRHGQSWPGRPLIKTAQSIDAEAAITTLIASLVEGPAPVVS